MNPFAIGGAALGIFQTIRGIRDTKRGNDALNAFDRQELENVYEGLSISTYGSDLLREENARGAATAYDAARSGGIRGITSSLSKIQAQTNNLNQRAAADLDQQVVRRNYAIAGDDARIRGIQEQRDNAELAGIGQLIQNGKQDTLTGLRGIGSAAASFVSGGLLGGGGGGGESRTQVEQIGGNLQSFGASLGVPGIPGASLLPQVTTGSGHEQYLQQQENQRLLNEVLQKNNGY